MYGEKSRINDTRYNDIPDITITIWQPKRKIYPDHNDKINHRAIGKTEQSSVSCKLSRCKNVE